MLDLFVGNVYTLKVYNVNTMSYHNKWYVILICIGIALIILLLNLFTTQSNRSIIFTNIQRVFNKPTITPTPIDTIKLKKDALAEYYQSIIQAELDKNYEKLYEYYKPSLGTWVTKDQYISYQKSWLDKKNIISHEMVIHDIKIEGDFGVIDRTRYFCFSKSCLSGDKEIDHQIKHFEYIDGYWLIPRDKQPSERALKAASYLLLNIYTSGTSIYNKYTYGTENTQIGIHFLAVMLDQDLQKLVSSEIMIDTHKQEKSRPVVNYQPPDINVQAPDQAPINNRMNCTTNTIGSYTYTNCY